MGTVKHLFKTPQELVEELVQNANTYSKLVVVGLIKEDQQTDLAHVTFLDASYMTNADANWLLDRGKILLHNSEEMEVTNAN